MYRVKAHPQSAGPTAVAGAAVLGLTGSPRPGSPVLDQLDELRLEPGRKDIAPH
ncbi:hypothetical protein [Streptomyces sp. NPDC002666]